MGVTFELGIQVAKTVGGDAERGQLGASCMSAVPHSWKRPLWAEDSRLWSFLQGSSAGRDGCGSPRGWGHCGGLLPKEGKHTQRASVAWQSPCKQVPLLGPGNPAGEASIFHIMAQLWKSGELASIYIQLFTKT